MAKQTFVADAILTAAQMNALQGNDFNQTVSTKTASYVLVASDAGTKLVMNAGATNTTLTVNTSLFAAGDTLTILNISTSGTCTITAGTATVATAGSLALGLNQGGTLYFTSAGVSIFQADGVAASASGFVLLNSTTISASATTNVNDVFSATYDNYRIFFNGTNTSGGPAVSLRLRVSSTDSSTNYSYQRLYGQNTTAAAERNVLGTDEFFVTESENTSSSYAFDCVVFSPFAVASTKFISHALATASGQNVYDIYGVNTNATSFTGFSILASTGSISGTLKVYGMANS